MTLAFSQPHWLGTNVIINLIMKDGLYSDVAQYFPPEKSIEELVSEAFNGIQCQLPLEDDFSEESAETPQTVPPELRLTLDIYGRSAFFNGLVPVARIHHTTETHQDDCDDPYLWRSHFEYIRLEVDESAFVEGARRALDWDVDDATDSDYVSDSDDSSSDSDSGSAISESFRRSPTAL
jgi:hypothetical protein